MMNACHFYIRKRKIVVSSFSFIFFLGLNAQETQKLNFSLQHHLSSGLLGTKVGVMLRQGSEEGGSTGHPSVASSNLQSKTLAVFLIPAGTF